MAFSIIPVIWYGLLIRYKLGIDLKKKQGLMLYIKVETINNVLFSGNVHIEYRTPTHFTLFSQKS